MTWSTQDLQAYLAGDASAADAAAIEADLARDPQLETRLMALDPLSDQLGGAADAMAGPSDAQMAQWVTPETTQRSFGWSHLAAAAVVGAVLVGAGWLANPAASTSNWRVQVATYQALYSPETIAAIAFDADELATQIDTVGARVGFNNLRQITDNIDELELLRGQILTHDGQPLAQIVFASAAGEPIALCLIKRDADADDAEITMANLSGLASASFETENHSWILIGTQDEALIARTARQVAEQLSTL